MKITNFLILGAFVLLSSVSQASVAVMDIGIFKCSDGIDYNVVRHYWGGWGNGNWKLAGFCNKGILSEENYEGRVMEARDSHPDIARCQDEDSSAVRACFVEFRELNGSRGLELTPIIDGRRDNTAPPKPPRHTHPLHHSKKQPEAMR